MFIYLFLCLSIHFLFVYLFIYFLHLLIHLFIFIYLFTYSFIFIYLFIYSCLYIIYFFIFAYFYFIFCLFTYLFLIKYVFINSILFVYLFCLLHARFGQNHMAGFLKANHLTYNVLGMTSWRLRSNVHADKCDTEMWNILWTSQNKKRAGTELGMWGASGKEMTARETRDETAVWFPSNTSAGCGGKGRGSVNWTAETLPARLLDGTAVLSIRAFRNYQHQTYVSQILSSGVCTNQDTALSTNTWL